jgi:hypothetical protein
MEVANKLKVLAKDFRRVLKLSPMFTVFIRLKQRGVRVSTLDALEVFGGVGESHTRDIYSSVASLTIWEIRPEFESILNQRFPKSEIKITNSYLEIMRTTATYNLVVVDNASRHGVHYEHFDLFPNIFRILNNPAIMILNVIPKVLLTREMNAQRLRERKRFYNTDDPANISFEEFETTYLALAAQNGWKVEWFFYCRRWPSNVYYAVLSLKH